MSNIRQKYPIFLSIGVLLAALIFSFAGVGLVLGLSALFPGLSHQGDFLVSLIAEVVMLLGMILLCFLLGMGHVFREKGRGFFGSMAPAGFILGYYIYAGLASMIMSMYDPLQPLPQIIFFILCMAAIGMTEELAFRGLITRMIFDKYGHSRAGIWLTVVVSGIIFGGMHLVNAAGGAVPLEGVLIQVIGAAALGMCLSAVYLRGRNLWSVAVIHGFMDFCALISAGIFTSSTIVDTVAGYSPVMLVGSLFYFLLAAFLLRKSKLEPFLTGESAGKSTVIKLSIAVVVLLLMVAVVLVLTL